MSKVGLGVITYNRKEFYQNCMDFIRKSGDMIDELVTVNDGESYGGLDHSTKYGGHLIQHKENKGVGVSKNHAMQYLMDQDCDHIFLIEDDITITNPGVFEAYITASQKSGLPHFMYGYHGPANKINGEPTPRLVIDYGDDTQIALNTHCVGAFCYYTKSILERVGLMDEAYKNAWEHVDHSYMIVKSDLLPAYWWWPDIANSYDYLSEQACSEVIEAGAIRKRDDWMDNINTGMLHFHKKHGHQPGGAMGVPDTDSVDVIARLKNIKQHRDKLCTI